MSVLNRYLRKYRPQLEKLTDVRTLFSLLLISAVLTIAMFLVAVTQLHLTDPPRVVTPVASPADPATPRPRAITVGLSVEDLLVFDMAANNFEFDGAVWFEGELDGLDLTQLETFTFDRGKVLSKSAARREGSRITYLVRGRVLTDLRYELFPFDDHRLDIVVELPMARAGEIALTTGNDIAVLPAPAVPDGWRLLSTEGRAGLRPVQLSRNGAIGIPEAVFSFSFKHTGFRRTFAVFVPLFFIFFLGLSSLTLDPTKDFPSVLALAVGSLTALLFYKIVVAEITPIVDYFTIADFVYTLLLVIVTMIFCLHVVLLHHYERWTQTTSLASVLATAHRTGAIIRGLAFIASIAAILVSLAVILW